MLNTLPKRNFVIFTLWYFLEMKEKAGNSSSLKVVLCVITDMPFGFKLSVINVVQIRATWQLKNKLHVPRFICEVQKIVLHTFQ